MTYTEALSRITPEFAGRHPETADDLFQLLLDYRRVGEPTTWERYRQNREWLATALEDLEAVFRAPVTPGTARPGTP